MKKQTHAELMVLSRHNFLWQLTQIQTSAGLLMETYLNMDAPVKYQDTVIVWSEQDNAADKLNAAVDQVNQALNHLVRARQMFS